MARLALLGGAYSAQGIIASKQRAINLYPEKNPSSAQPPVQVTHYPRPGRTPFGVCPIPGPGRCLYGATNGDLYAVVGQNVFYIDPNGTYTQIGTLVTVAGTPASMADNGQEILLVDGSPQGYQIVMGTRVLTQVGDPNYLGADRVDFLDSFLVMNQPGTPNWYSTLSNAIAFNALDFGSKTAWPDPVQSIITCERQIWLLGTKKSEIWYNAGTSPFYAQALPGVIVEQGCCAKYSPAKQDINVYWLSQSPEGARMAVKGTQNSAQRISNHAIEAEWLTYARVDDAIGSTLQIAGHQFYKLDFPTANKTWVYDEVIGDPNAAWHEEAYTDTNGVFNRTRDSFCADAYGKNYCLDFANGSIYQIDPSNFTDFGNPMVCLRSFPHVVGPDYERFTVWRVIADIEAGIVPGTTTTPLTLSPWSLGFSPGFGPRTLLEPPEVSARWSFDRGGSFGNKVMQPMGAAGLYKTQPTWRRLGYGTDFVLELSWSTPMKTALQGVFLDFEIHEDDKVAA